MYNDIKKLAKPERWQEWVESNTDDYGGQCVKTAYHLMRMLDDPATEITPEAVHGLVSQADDKEGGGITGFMAGAVAQMVSECHERGDEFRRAWNADVQIGTEGDEANESGGVLNPAVMVIGGGNDG